jgi:hypothetical protein
LAESDVPKLFVDAEPGAVVRGRIRETLEGTFIDMAIIHERSARSCRR